MKTRNLIAGLPWIFGLVYFLLSMDLPFWGDSIASVSKAAVRIYLDGLDRPWNYPDADPGHPTLYPWLIALAWKLLGFELWVAHALAALCFVALIRILQTWMVLWDEKLQLSGTLLLLVAPLSVSQAIEISLQLPLTLAFFTAVYGLKKHKHGLWLLGILCLPMIHIQGIILLGVVGVYDAWRNWPLKSAWLKRSLFYLLPAGVFAIWLYFHQREFGWALFTPNFPRAAPGLKTILYNLGISGWRLLDLGYFLLSIPVILQVCKLVIRKKWSDTDRLFIPLALFLCAGIPVLFAYPPNHRYFFPVYLLLVPLFIRYLQNHSPKKQALWLFSALALLLSGNLWHYPGKCLGDQNLVFLSIHDLEKNFAREYPGVSDVYSYAPLNNSGLYTRLDSTNRPEHHDLYDLHFDSLDWIYESNLNCEFTADDRERLRRDFVPRTYEAYGVYLTVWMNRRLLDDYPDFPGSEHRASRMEQNLLRLKQRLKGN